MYCIVLLKHLSLYCQCKKWDELKWQEERGVHKVPDDELSDTTDDDQRAKR